MGTPSLPSPPTAPSAPSAPSDPSTPSPSQSLPVFPGPPVPHIWLWQEPTTKTRWSCRAMAGRGHRQGHLHHHPPTHLSRAGVNPRTLCGEGAK